MKKWLIFIFIMTLVGVFIARDTILNRILQVGMERRMSANTLSELADGLHVILCGAGGPMPAPNASGPCVLVIAGQRMFVIDAGTDGIRNIARMGFSAGAIEAVFLTHFHSDHIDGLGELATLRWVSAANTSPLPVFGPTGVEEIVSGLNQAYALDQKYRYQHHGEAVAPLSGAGMRALPFATPKKGALISLIDEPDLQIKALYVDHFPVQAAVAYRITYQGRTTLITGDTKQLDNITQFAQGVDLLVHEALAPNLVTMMGQAAEKVGNTILAKVAHDILDYHASPKQAAQTARDAKVGHLLYYHIVPPLIVAGQEGLYLNGAERIFPDYTVGEDGCLVSLPVNSKQILIDRLRL